MSTSIILHRTRLAATVLCGATLALAACLDDGGTGFDPRKTIPPDSGAPDAGLPAPILDRGSIPTTTCGDKVGIVGRATPGVSIIVQGGSSASGVIGDALAGSGSFCVPVGLRKGQVNNLQVIAHDQNLGFSKPATIAIKQEDCEGGGGEFKDAGVGDAGADPPRNVALGAQGKSKETPTKGNHGFLTDGKTSTWVRWEGGSWYCNWCDYEGWVMLTLDELHEVQRIVIKWRDADGNGTEYGKEYKLLYTAVSDPPDPNLDDGYWTVAKTITEGNGGTDSYDLKSIGSPLMTYVALWLQQDAYPWTKEFIGDEAFAVAEIEVYNKPKSSGPPPPPPSICGEL